MTPHSVPTCYFINWGLIIDRLVFVRPPAGPRLTVTMAHAWGPAGPQEGASSADSTAQSPLSFSLGAHSLEGGAGGWCPVTREAPWWMLLICVSFHPHNNLNQESYSHVPPEVKQAKVTSVGPSHWGGAEEGAKQRDHPSPGQASCLRTRRVFPGAVGLRGTQTVQAALPRPGGFTANLLTGRAVAHWQLSSSSSSL